MLILPADGVVVPDPETKKPLPPEGRNVATLSKYWRRRLDEGAILVDDSPAVDPAQVGKDK